MIILFIRPPKKCVREIHNIGYERKGGKTGG
jgi:hypothetical protein